jgi:hypothetical protein
MSTHCPPSPGGEDRNTDGRDHEKETIGSRDIPGYRPVKVADDEDEDEVLDAIGPISIHDLINQFFG